jgi:hypothetical protein
MTSIAPPSTNYNDKQNFNDRDKSDLINSVSNLDLLNSNNLTSDKTDLPTTILKRITQLPGLTYNQISKYFDIINATIFGFPKKDSIEEPEKSLLDYSFSEIFYYFQINLVESVDEYLNGEKIINVMQKKNRMFYIGMLLIIFSIVLIPLISYQV